MSNLNSLLSDIYVRFVQIKEDFRLHYRVIDRIFLQLHERMAEVDPYYKRYSSTVLFGGSHYDKVRIVKPDEFDTTIVIGLPVSLNCHPTNTAASDVTIEPKTAGYVQLRMGTQFQNLPKNVAQWPINKASYAWMDGSKYLLRSKFIDWFKSVVSQALNTFEIRNALPQYCVDGVPYSIRKSESGPAMTLIIENKSRGFKSRRFETRSACRSYFIKNLFFWEMVETQMNAKFWHMNNPADLFKLMVGKLYKTLETKKIRYFWNGNENLLARVEESVLVEYAAKLRPLVKVLDNSRECMEVAKYLLTPQELKKMK